MNVISEKGNHTLMQTYRSSGMEMLMDKTIQHHFGGKDAKGLEGGGDTYMTRQIAASNFV